MLSPAERERQETWALLARLATMRGAPSALPGGFATEIETEYQALRAEIEAWRGREAGDAVDPEAHERLRARARALLRTLEDQ